MSDDVEFGRQAIDAGLFAEGALRDDLEGGAPPEVPDKYELRRCLGRGGAGVVWLANDRVLQRPLAIKFLNEGRHGLLDRFRREARFTARIQSPSIIEVYEMAEHDGRPYIAMQYVDGGNLAEVELERDALVSTFRDVARALHRAHEAGIVHRDIKPENILLDIDHRPFLTDFGIALDLWAAPGATISQDGQIMGTPASMAPEQARGELHAVDARSDVYALGATLFFKLTGRWPFRGESIVDVLHAVIHDDPPFPRSLVHDIPRGLELVVLKCLQKDPADRYPSMRRLADELDGVLAGREPMLGPSAWFRKLVAPGARLAGPAPAQQREDPYWTVGMEIARELALWDANRYRISKNLARTFPQLDEIVTRLDVHLERHPDCAWARYYRGQALFRRGRLEEAREDLERAVDRMERQPGAFFDLGRLYLAIFLEEHERARRHLIARGVRDHIDEHRGTLAQAVRAFREARRLKDALPEWQERFPDAVQRLAEDDFTGCVEICDQVLAKDPDAEEVWKLRGDAQRCAGQEPWESYARAREIRRSYVEVWLAEAEERATRGEVARALECVERALEIHPELVDALVLGARARLGRAPDGAERAELEAALVLCRRATEIDPQHYEARVTCGEVRARLAAFEDDDRMSDAALADFEQALSLPGCQNRVSYLCACAHLDRAQRKRARGEDPSADLRAVFALRDGVQAARLDAPMWRALFAAAEGLVAR